MAVLSRPSHRISTRKRADQELPATERARKPPESRPGKRARNTSFDHDSDTSSKKVKFEATSNARKALADSKPAQRTLAIRDRQSVGVSKDLLTQHGRARKLDPVLAQPKFTTASSTLSLDEELHRGINQNIPPPTADQVDKRSLRSQVGGSRSKSELAPYFHDFEALISIEPRKPGTAKHAPFQTKH